MRTWRSALQERSSQARQRLRFHRALDLNARFESASNRAEFRNNREIRVREEQASESERESRACETRAGLRVSATRLTPSSLAPLRGLCLSAFGSELGADSSRGPRGGASCSEERSAGSAASWVSRWIPARNSGAAARAAAWRPPPAAFPA